MLEKENVVALCDVNSKALAAAAEKFPKAKQYKDWRKCLDQRDLDAVVVCTPDHHHAFISIWAMNRGLHVYGEKPLANSVEEARMVRDTYMKNKNKLATQCGTQRHFDPNFDYIRELIHEGAIGDLQDVHAWGNRFHEKTGYPKATGSAPDYLDWDLDEPSPIHPFSEDYFMALNWRAGKWRSLFRCRHTQVADGSNCLSWNMYRSCSSRSAAWAACWTNNPLDADYPFRERKAALTIQK